MSVLDSGINSGGITADDIVRVPGKALIADDNPKYTGLMKRVLFEFGFESETTNDPTDVLGMLTKYHFPLILCDNIFDRYAEKGSEIILGNPLLFENSKTVLVTGHPMNQIAAEELISRGVTIVQKGDGHVERIIEICRRTFMGDMEFKSDDYRLVSDCYEPELPTIVTTDKSANISPYERLVTSTRTRLRSFISELPNPDTPQFYVDGKSLSPNQILLELENDESEIGALLVEILLADVLGGDDD